MPLLLPFFPSLLFFLLDFVPPEAQETGSCLRPAHPLYLGLLHMYMYVCMHVYACLYACMHACMHACIYVCMYACMHACMYICMYVYVHTYNVLTNPPIPSSLCDYMANLHNFFYIVRELTQGSPLVTTL
jgi:hypothetical protein